MSRSRRSLGFHLVAFLAVACLALPTGATLEAIEHLGHHAENGDFLHSEAAHPDAPRHVEREEHLGADGCVACAHGSATVGTPILLGTHEALDSEQIVLEARSSRRTAQGLSSPARAPPA